jgi:hypothetical protein
MTPEHANRRTTESAEAAEEVRKAHHRQAAEDVKRLHAALREARERYMKYDRAESGD